MPIVVHHLNDSRSQRILWLLEELEIPYEVKKYQRTKQHLAPAELLAINPLGKSPVITDDGITLAESGAIIEYLLEKFGNGRGQPPASGKLDNLYFTHYSEGSFLPVLIRDLINNAVRSQSPFLLRPLVNIIFNQLGQMTQAEITKNLDLIEAHLTKVGGGFFAGGEEPTSADYMMAFPLEALAKMTPERLGPNTLKYVQMIHARPAYKRGLQRGGSYTYASL